LVCGPPGAVFTALGAGFGGGTIAELLGGDAGVASVRACVPPEAGTTVPVVEAGTSPSDAGGSTTEAGVTPSDGGALIEASTPSDAASGDASTDGNAGD
jgi:hypothetical protein